MGEGACGAGGPGGGGGGEGGVREGGAGGGAAGAGQGDQGGPDRRFVELFRVGGGCHVQEEVAHARQAAALAGQGHAGGEGGAGAGRLLGEGEVRGFVQAGGGSDEDRADACEAAAPGGVAAGRRRGARRRDDARGEGGEAGAGLPGTGDGVRVARRGPVFQEEVRDARLAVGDALVEGGIAGGGGCRGRQPGLAGGQQAGALGGRGEVGRIPGVPGQEEVAEADAGRALDQVGFRRTPSGVRDGRRGWGTAGWGVWGVFAWVRNSSTPVWPE